MLLKTGGNYVVPLDRLQQVFLGRLESEGAITVYLSNPGVRVELAGVEAIDFLYRYCPAALEGKALRWLRHRWAFHNLIAHPVMQLLAFVGLTKLGLKLHDATIPRPKLKEKRNA